LADGRRASKIWRRKTASYNIECGEKKRVSGTEHEVVVRIPPVVRLRVVRVEPRAIVIPIEVEHVRVTVAVSYVCSAVCSTAVPIMSPWGVQLYFMRDRKSPSTAHQVFSFL
jgi:hypothetical protein